MIITDGTKAACKIGPEALEELALREAMLRIGYE